jgi:phosphopantetheine adenylyltransferase
MSSEKFVLNGEMMKLLAETTARHAAETLVNSLREDIHAQHEETRKQLREEIKNELGAYFGEMKGAKHIVQHDRFDRLIKLFDRLGENFLGKIITNVVVGILIVAAMGYLTWHKIFG